MKAQLRRLAPWKTVVITLVALLFILGIASLPDKGRHALDWIVAFTSEAALIMVLSRSAAG